MFKNIITTASVRLLQAVISFGVVLISTRMLGSAVFGEIGLMILLITLIMLANDLIAGSSIVYFSSRYPTWQVVVPAYLWAVITISLSGLMLLGLSFFPSIYHTIIPQSLEIHILTLSLLNSFSAIHQYLLIGNEKIKSYNAVFISQYVTQLLSLAIAIFVYQVTNIYAYVYSLYISYLATWLVGIFATRTLFFRCSLRGNAARVKAFMRYGILIQIANLVQLGNRRFSFYVVKPYFGLSTLGVYNAAIQLTEALKIIASSISLVQYSRITNAHDEQYSAQLTVQLMKFTVIITLAALAVLLLIPSHIFVWIFGNDFADVKSAIIWLAPGVIFLAINAIYSHFFSGIGHPQHNTIGSSIGFVLFLSFCFIFIPRFGIAGAGLTTSLSYFGIVVYQSIIFYQRTKISFQSFLIHHQDIQYFKELIQENKNHEKA